MGRRLPPLGPKQRARQTGRPAVTLSRDLISRVDGDVDARALEAPPGLVVAIECERDAGREEEVVATQLARSLADLTAQDLARIIAAYEPVWAIGTGHTATPEQAQRMHAFIRHWISQRFDRSTAEGLRILYGGSVKPENIYDLMREADIDGALVGGASLDAESFAKIVNYDR